MGYITLPTRGVDGFFSDIVAKVKGTSLYSKASGIVKGALSTGEAAMPGPTAPAPTPQPEPGGMFDSLPSWALPVGAGLALLFFMRKGGRR